MFHVERSPDGELSIAASNSGTSVKRPRTTVLAVMGPTRIAGARFRVYSVGGGELACSEGGSANVVCKYGFIWAGGPGAFQFSGAYWASFFSIILNAGFYGTVAVAIVGMSRRLRNRMRSC